MNISFEQTGTIVCYLPQSEGPCLTIAVSSKLSYRYVDSDGKVRIIIAGSAISQRREETLREVIHADVSHDGIQSLGYRNSAPIRKRLKS